MLLSNAGGESLFGAVRLGVLAAADGFVAVSAGASRSPVVLNRTSYQILARTTLFKTLQQHARDCRANGFERTPINEIDAELRTLVELGLLLPASSRFESQASPTGPQPPPITTVAIVTKDRPRSLDRCVRSIGSNLSTNNRQAVIRIYDDSVQRDSWNFAAAYRAENPQQEVAYAGPLEKHRFLGELASLVDLPTDLIKFAFGDSHGLGAAYGANLNCLLADTSGDMVLTVDDDVVFRLAPPPGQGQGLAVTSDFDPTTINIFETRDDATAEIAWQDVDVAGVHEQILGRSALALSAHRERDVDVTRASGASHLFENSRECLVAATMTGLVGDSGTGLDSWIHFAGPMQDRLLESEDSYIRLRNSSNITRSTQRPTVSEGQFFMSTMAGLDNRSVLPPFFPVLRNQDGVFGCLLRSCWPSRMTGHLPWLALHDPMPEYSRSRTPGVRGFRFSDLLMGVVRAADFVTCGTDPIKRLQRVSNDLLGIASLDESSYRLWLESEWSRHLAADLLWHRRLLNRGTGRIGMWRVEIEHRIANFEKDLLAKKVRVIDLPNEDLLDEDLPAEPHEKVAGSLVRRLMADYGRLLQHWPRVMEACLHLRSCGRGLSRGIPAGRTGACTSR